MAIIPFTDATFRSRSFYPKVVKYYAQSAPFMHFPCQALELSF